MVEVYGVLFLLAPICAEFNHGWQPIQCNVELLQDGDIESSSYATLNLRVNTKFDIKKQRATDELQHLFVYLEHAESRMKSLLTATRLQSEPSNSNHHSLTTVLDIVNEPVWIPRLAGEWSLVVEDQDSKRLCRHHFQVVERRQPMSKSTGHSGTHPTLLRLRT